VANKIIESFYIQPILLPAINRGAVAKKYRILKSGFFVHVLALFYVPSGKLILFYGLFCH
jgi:hypothetical protein